MHNNLYIITLKKKKEKKIFKRETSAAILIKFASDYMLSYFRDVQGVNIFI